MSGGQADYGYDSTKCGNSGCSCGCISCACGHHHKSESSRRLTYYESAGDMQRRWNEMFAREADERKQFKEWRSTLPWWKKWMHYV